MNKIKSKKENNIMPAEDLMLLLHNIDLLHKSVQKSNNNSISETDENNFNTDEISQINNHISVSEVQTEVKSELSSSSNNKIQNNKKEKNSKNSTKQKKQQNSNCDSNVEQNNIEVDITPTFKNNIMTYIKIDDLIKNKMEEIKELKDAKKKYEEDILNYLNNINQTSINYGEITLRKNEYTSKGSLKNEYLKEVIGNELGDPTKTEKILENLENKKMETATKRLGLKRTKRNLS